MKRTISTIFMSVVLLATASAADIDAAMQKAAIERVKEYCILMEHISGDVEKIEEQENLYAMCENANVSVFNDLAAVRTKDISDNSMPLQQYMMLLTSKYDNEVKVTHTGFKYVKTVEQRTTVEDFQAARWAFVSVKKQLSGKGLKSAERLNILVDVNTMKISSTVSEDYEDPQSIYLAALEKFNAGKYAEAIPLFEKVSTFPRFAGRYRAQSMLGWARIEMKDYEKAAEALRIGSREDPLGSLILSQKILMSSDVPFSLRNRTEGVNILTKIGEARDKEIPTMHLIAKSAIVDAIINGDKAFTRSDMLRLADDLTNDPLANDECKVRGYLLKAVADMHADDEATKKLSLANFNAAGAFLESSSLKGKEYEYWDKQITGNKLPLLLMMSEKDEALKILQEARSTKKYLAKAIAQIYLRVSKNKELIKEYFHIAAGTNDPLSLYLLSLWYLPVHEPMRNYEKTIYNTVLRQSPYYERYGKNWEEFIVYLLTGQNNKRSVDSFLALNQAAIDNGDYNSMELRAYLAANSDAPNAAEILKMACEAAVSGEVNRSMGINNGLYVDTWMTLQASEISQGRKGRNTQWYAALDSLYNEGNAAAAYLLYNYYAMDEQDEAKAMECLERASDGHLYEAMRDYGQMLALQGDADGAMRVLDRLTAFSNSGVYGFMGDIERDYRSNNVKALEYYHVGIEKEKDWNCYLGLSDMYKDGKGVERDLRKARKLMDTAMERYKLISEEQYADMDPIWAEIKSKSAELDRLIAAGGNAVATSTSVSSLNAILSASLTEEQRIEQSKTLLGELFASPKAVVKTVGSNGTTVVATQTAEDFMLSVATMQAGMTVREIASKKDTTGKLTELVVTIGK